MAIECYHQECKLHDAHGCVDPEECEGPFCNEEECIETRLPTLFGAFRMAAVCGLYTTDEAVLNADRHTMNFLPYEEIPGYLERLYAQYKIWQDLGMGDKIPKYLIEEEDKKLTEYFDKMNNECMLEAQICVDGTPHPDDIDVD